jgi:hypothetical protein
LTSDGLAKRSESRFYVIPAEVGIQPFQHVPQALDLDFRRGDDFSQPHRTLEPGGPPDMEATQMFPNPLQMAMMGGALAESLHEEREQSFEQYADEIEGQLRSYQEAYQQLHEAYVALQAHATDLEARWNVQQQQIQDLNQAYGKVQEKFVATVGELDKVQASVGIVVKEFQKFYAGYQQVKELLRELFVNHADRVLQPAYASCKEKVLELLDKLP